MLAFGEEVSGYDIKKWAEDYLATLVGAQPARSLLAGIRALFGGQSDQAPLALR